MVGNKPPFGHPVYVLTHHPRQLERFTHEEHDDSEILGALRLTLAFDEAGQVVEHLFLSLLADGGIYEFDGHRTANRRFTGSAVPSSSS